MASSDTTATNSVFLIPEILENILVNDGSFAAIDLIFYRAVCRTWRDVIDNSPTLREYMETGVMPYKGLVRMKTEEELREYCRHPVTTPKARDVIQIFWKKLVRIFRKHNGEAVSTTGYPLGPVPEQEVIKLFELFVERTKGTALIFPPPPPYQDNSCPMESSPYRKPQQQSSESIEEAYWKPSLLVDSMIHIVFAVARAGHFKLISDPQDTSNYIISEILSISIIGVKGPVVDSSGRSEGGVKEFSARHESDLWMSLHLDESLKVDLFWG